MENEKGLVERVEFLEKEIINFQNKQNQIEARNNELSSNNYLLVEQIKKLKKEKKILEKKLSDIDSLLDSTLKKCASCGKWCVEECMEYLGNELICETCRTNGYGE